MLHVCFPLKETFSGSIGLRQNFGSMDPWFRVMLGYDKAILFSAAHASIFNTPRQVFFIKSAREALCHLLISKHFWQLSI